jgi:hypothetical protein
MINYEAKATERRTRLGATLFAIGTAVWFLVVAAVHLTSSYQGADYRCSVAGPWSSVASASEASFARGDFSWWPIGRVCEWHMANGDIDVVRTADWGGTVLVYGIAAVAVWGAVLAVWPARRRDTTEPETQP